MRAPLQSPDFILVRFPCINVHIGILADALAADSSPQRRITAIDIPVQRGRLWEGGTIRLDGSKAILKSSQENAGRSLIRFQSLGRILHCSWLCSLGLGPLTHPSYFSKGCTCLLLSGFLSRLLARRILGSEGPIVLYCLGLFSPSWQIFLKTWRKFCKSHRGSVHLMKGTSTELSEISPFLSWAAAGKAEDLHPLSFLEAPLFNNMVTILVLSLGHNFFLTVLKSLFLMIASFPVWNFKSQASFPPRF